MVAFSTKKVDASTMPAARRGRYFHTFVLSFSQTSCLPPVARTHRHIKQQLVTRGAAAKLVVFGRFGTQGVSTTEKGSDVPDMIPSFFAHLDCSEFA
jgi:hypothetical protein